MRAGRLRTRVRFENIRIVDDGQGGSEPGKWRVLNEVWGEYMPERGHEQVAAGRLEASNLIVLRVRYSPLLSDMLVASARAMIGEIPHQIRSIIDPDQRRRTLELVLEKGVAPHG